MYAQSLQAGDLAFTGFNADGPGEGFAVVFFTTVSGGEELHFNSREWNGSAFTGNGGSLTWTAPSGGIAAGSVISVTGVEDEPSVTLGAITHDANMNLRESGDVIYAYAGADKSSPDTPFLGAISSDADLYNQPQGTEGTLENTGLTQSGDETILLPDNFVRTQYTGDRTGNTPSGYRALLNDIETREDNWDHYNDSDEAAIPPFNGESFDVVSPPAIAFTSNSLAVSEDENSVELTIELVESNNTAVDVEVVFESSSSTADANDIDGYVTQTVSFGSAASSGATKTVTVTLKDDLDFEGAEEAVFQLRNNTSGSIIKPSVLTLSINDDEEPSLVFNEINADPGGDTNGDGILDADGDEFVEIINNETFDVDLSNWSLSNSNEAIFTFPQGTVVPAGKATVVFADSAKGTGYGGARLYHAGSLDLNNGGEVVKLEDADGNVIASLDYATIAADADNGQSITRDPDITGSFEPHSNADGSQGDLHSPGRKVDGTAFGSKYAIGIRGGEGWRLISTPTQNTSFDDLFRDIWIQGISGSDDDGAGFKNIITWDEASLSYLSPSSMSEDLVAGKGYAVYVYEDDDPRTPGVQGGFPKSINTNNTDGTENNENPNSVDVGITANDTNENGSIDGDEGWNLLGNPFGTDISVDALFTALENANSNVNTNIYVWDPNKASGPGYVELSKGEGKRLAPFQAFWVRYTQGGIDTDVTLNRNDLAVSGEAEFYRSVSDNNTRFELSLHGEQFSDTYTLEFSDRGSTDLDKYDGYHLTSLNPNSISLYSSVNNKRIQKNVLPKDLEATLEIPLAFKVAGRTSLTFKWDNKINNIPDEWDILLIDKEQNREIDLRRSSEYSFTLRNSQQNTADGRTPDTDFLNKSTNDESGARFVLSVQPKGETVESADLPESVKLNPNYPNPFNPATTIPYELTEDAEVKLTVWNMIGQKVATLVDGLVEAGSHEETWNASNMPSGIYIARFEVGSKVFTRKMTLIK